MSLIQGEGGTNAGASSNANGANAANAGAAGAQDAGAAAGANSGANQGDWFYADNIKGDGAVPDWFKGDKYKTVTDQAKAYADAEKRLGGFKGAPDKYDLTLAEHPELKFSEEDPILKDFAEKAREAGVSQEFFSELLGVYAQAITYGLPDADAEMKKIGANAEQDLQILAQWAGNILNQEEFGIFKSMVMTADGFKVFEKLRMAGTGSDVAPPNNPPTHENKDQVLQMINDPRYDTDPEFRAEMRRKLSVAMAREGGKK